MRSILRPTGRRAVLSLAGAAVLGISGVAVAANAGAAPSAGHAPWSRVCSAPAAGDAACHALKVSNVSEKVKALGVTPNATPSGLGPADLLSAYNLPANGGAGQTIAIVDAYNDPSAEADMNTYRAQYGLPACTSASGCFKQVNQTGGSKLPRSNSSWAGEISLDLD
ncbi:MAG: peptidase S8, partial [Catenulispora sp.]|nr:peptidase S8 [Catenulispora sp.]